MFIEGLILIKVVTSPNGKFKSTKTTFSRVCLANSTAKFVAIAVLPIPPLFEKIDIILELFIVLEFLLQHF